MCGWLLEKTVQLWTDPEDRETGSKRYALTDVSSAQHIQEVLMRPIWLLFPLLLVVAACSDSGVDPAEVTGTEECRQITSDGLSASYECEDKTSDPRVSGVATVTVAMEQEPPTAMSGTFELVNDQGRWVGDWTGESSQSQNHIMDAVLVGTGEYEGLEYDAHWEGVQEPLTITGTIRASE